MAERRTAEGLRRDAGARAALERRLRGPVKPLPDNVTPPTRTPWGGRRIFSALKRGLPGIPAADEAPVVGESWEISDDPAFPSDVPFPVGNETHVVSLSEALDLFAGLLLGAADAAAFGGRLPLLVKLIDAQDDLSVQVHPPREHAGLRPGLSGKSEAWVILAREPGAGIYLGLAEAADEPVLRETLARGEDLSSLLPFVPVRPGEVFGVPAGTVHAIGRGCTLLEIQRFSPPATGMTYRLWDWNRRYDERGRPDPAGRPRELHVDDALSVIDFGAPRGDDGVARLRQEPRRLRSRGGSAEDELLADLDGMRLRRLTLAPGAPLTLPTGGRFAGLTCTAGRLSLLDQSADQSAQGRPTPLRAGESALLPAALGSVIVAADRPSELYVVTLS